MSKLLNKVSDVTVLFWVIKIISTTIGETSADFFSHKFGMGALVIVSILLATSAFIQMRFKRYVPWMYWGVIVIMAVFGTMFADWLRKSCGIPLEVTSGGFLVLLFITLSVWYMVEKSLDTDNINTTRREIFYWLVIFITFALGTAAGDLVADNFHLGYLNATLVFGAIMVIIPAVLYLLKINSVALFWITYILTRPFGASGGDLLSHPVQKGGFGYGTGTTSLAVTGIMLLLIIYLTVTHKKEMDIEEHI